MYHDEISLRIQADNAARMENWDLYDELIEELEEL